MLNWSLRQLFDKARLPINLNEEKERKFSVYLKELQKWNEKINLTSIKDEAEIVEKLFLDSLFFLKFLDIKPDSNCLDIGSGAGFPGIPIKIMVSDINLTLFEATKKKASFLKHIIRVLSLKKTQVINKRFGDSLDKESFSGKFDMITVKGVAIDSELIAASYTLLNQTGILLYFGGEKVIEIFSLKKLPFVNFHSKTYQLPLSKLNRTLLIFRK